MAKVVLILSVFLSCSILCLAQVDSARIQSTSTQQNITANQAEPDDDMNVFLITLAIAFFSAVLGAAVIGAFFAAFVFIIIVVGLTVGLFSTSLAVGLYKRSAGAGFKTFLVLLFPVFVR